jgi:hypothetical protein
MTYGPGTGDTGSAQPPRSYAGLLIGLVVVLLVICGGIAFTGWRFAGAGTGDRSTASGPAPQRAIRTSAPSLPTPMTATQTPSAEPSAVPAQGALVPFGASHVVEWPDHLQAVVVRARNFDLPAGPAATQPDEVAVLVELNAFNHTPNDVTLGQAAAKLWYGPGRQQAEEYVDKADNLGGGFNMTVWPGHDQNGSFLFMVPRQYLSQLVFELRPRAGDAPARFFGGAD